jgi:hypothetical protein
MEIDRVVYAKTILELVAKPLPTCRTIAFLIRRRANYPDL